MIPSPKDQHQAEMIGRFLAHLTALGRAVGRPTFGDAPDALVPLDGVDVGVELACAYAYPAADVWGPLRAGITAATPVASSSTPDGFDLTRLVEYGAASDRLVKALQRTLDDHCRARYGGPTILLLDASHDRLDGITTDALAFRLALPTHTFSEIYLVAAEHEWVRPFVRLV